MNPKMSIRNREGIYEGLREADQSIKQRERFENYWELGEEIGKGSILEIELRQGFDIVLMDCELQERFVSNSKGKLPTIGFNFLVSGRIKGRFRGIRDEVIMGSGQSGIAYSTDQSGSMEGLEKKHICIVSIQVALWQFSVLMDKHFDCMTADLQAIADGTHEKYYYRVGTTTPSMQMALHEILNCPYHGLTRRLYLESRGLELIAYKLEQLALGEGKIQRTLALRPDEIDRIHYAGEILTDNLENPPGIQELTRAIGLTHIKLQRGFRELYNTTAFGYLRTMRLDKAKILMEEHKMNVTETALAVGYSSISHFAKAFKEHFGIAPGRYLRELN